MSARWSVDKNAQSQHAQFSVMQPEDNLFPFKYKSTRRVSQIRRFIQQVCISYHIFSNKLMKTVVIKFHHMQFSKDPLFFTSETRVYHHP